MTVDLTIPFSLTASSVARILLDMEPRSIGANFGSNVQSMCRMYEEKNFVEERVKYHLTRYGRLGIPSVDTLAERFSVKEADVDTAINLLTNHLNKLGI